MFHTMYGIILYIVFKNKSEYFFYEVIKSKA